MTVMMDYTKENRRAVLCIDVKSFFASVEAVKHGLHPLHSEVVVMSRGNQNGGLVLAASPKVKEKYGLKTGSRKYEFPRKHQILIVPPRMGLYVRVNGLINQIFQQYAAKEDIHTYSIDESFIDITASYHLFGDTIFEVAQKIQRQIWEELRLAVAVGIGDNPLLAKLALDNEAKDTSSHIAYWSYESVPDTIWKIPNLTDMWGIGKRTAKRLNALGIYSVYDLAQADAALLKKRLGVIGSQLYYHAHGIDRSRISQKHQIPPSSKSIGTSQVLERDYTKSKDVELIIREMTIVLSERLRQLEKQTSCVSLSISYSRKERSKSWTKQMTISPTDQTKVLSDTLLYLFREHEADGAVRTIGLSFGKLVNQPYQQLNLFDEPERQVKTSQLDKVIDQVKSHYGKTALFPASSLQESGTYIKRSQLLGGHQRDSTS